MLRFCALLACLLISIGCGNPIEDRLVGTWIFDMEAAQTMPSFQALPPEQQEETRRNFASTAIELNFTPDRRASLDVTATGQRIRTGAGAPYRAVAKAGQRFAIEVERPTGKPDSYDAEFEGETLYVWFGKRKRPFRRKEP